MLAAGEIVTGTLLLDPLIPNGVAGAALTVFSGGLVAMYARTPAMHRPGSIWPTRTGIGVSKDVWMLGIGLSLLVSGSRRRGVPTPSPRPSGAPGSWTRSAQPLSRVVPTPKGHEMADRHEAWAVPREAQGTLSWTMNPDDGSSCRRGDADAHSGSLAGLISATTTGHRPGHAKRGVPCLD